MSSSSSSDSESQNASSSTQDAPKPPIEPIHLPTQEEIRAQDVWNSFPVRTVSSLVMGIFGNPISFNIFFFQKVSFFDRFGPSNLILVVFRRWNGFADGNVSWST